MSSSVIYLSPYLGESDRYRHHDHDYDYDYVINMMMRIIIIIIIIEKIFDFLNFGPGREENTSDSSHVIKDQERGEPGDQHQLHTLHLLLLESFLDHVPQLGGVGGVQAIPFMQVGAIDPPLVN